MGGNGKDPPTPRRWEITLVFRPLSPGTQGLGEVLHPVLRLLAFMDRRGERHIVVRIRRIDDWPADPSGE